MHVEQSADGRGLDLVFRSIAPGDDGRYACEATLDGRHEKEEFELKVIGKLHSQISRSPIRTNKATTTMLKNQCFQHRTHNF